MRLFLGMQVISPWPDEWPHGRLITEANRHLTLVFLGHREKPDLGAFPQPPFHIGPAGIFDKPLFLSHVIAWHIDWLENGELFLSYQNQLAEWLDVKGEFLSHVTLSREPYDASSWKKSFQKLPVYAKNIILYESIGNLQYQPLWEYPLLAPFDEIEHTADIAFKVRGNLYLHAQLALAFHFPQLIPYFDKRSLTNLDEIVTSLNRLIAQVDSQIGCPFKAVSFHDTRTNTGEWEMIVDV